MICRFCFFFFFSSRRRHTRSYGDWSSDVCSSDLLFMVRRLERTGSDTLGRTLAAATAITLIGLIGFGLAAGFAFALAAYWTTRLGRSVVYPLYMTWLNRSIDDSSVRATVISMTGQSDAVGQIAVGPGIGAVGSLVSIRAALFAAAALLVPAVGLYGRAGVGASGAFVLEGRTRWRRSRGCGRRATRGRAKPFCGRSRTRGSSSYSS